jgi:hypothetical protein
MTTATVNRSWGETAANALEWGLVEPLRVAWVYAPQVLITSASVFLNATFAQEILDPTFAWAQAIGFEWTWLRGLASAKRTRSPWVNRLNAGALVAVVFYGLMACLLKFDVLPAEPEPWLAVLLAVIHVGPLGFTAFCSAMIHRTIEAEEAERREGEQREKERIAREEGDRQRALAAQLAEADAQLQIEERRRRLDLELEDQRKRSELAIWEQAQVVRARTRGAPRAPASRAAPAASEDRRCPSCQAPLSPQEFGAYRSIIARGGRWKGCKACKGADAA